MTHRKDMAHPEMLPRGITGEREDLMIELQSIESPTIGFSQLLHQAAGFLLNSVLNAPLSHPKISQGHEGEAPHLLPSLPIAENDPYQEEKQRLGGRSEGRRRKLTLGSFPHGRRSAGELFKFLFPSCPLPLPMLDTYHFLY